MTFPSGALIAAIADIRTELAQRTGAVEWEAPGIRAALIATHGAPADVSAAACLAAGDKTLRFPSEAGFVQHWPRNASKGPDRSHNIPCPDHPSLHDMPCPNPPEPIEAAVRHSLAAQARANIRRPANTTRRVPTPGDATNAEAARTRADQEAGQ